MLNATPHGIILATGSQGQAKARVPSPLFEACGVPLIELVSNAMKAAGVEHPIAVVDSVTGPTIREAMGSQLQYAWVDSYVGTMHAVLAVRSLMEDVRAPVLVAGAEMGLLTDSAVRDLVRVHQERRPGITAATVRLHDPTGHPRIVRDPHGRVARIVGEEDANPKVRAIQEISAGLFCFASETLFAMGPRLLAERGESAQLSELAELIYDSGGGVETHIFTDALMFREARDPWQLAGLSKALRLRVIRRHCENGVMVVDPDSTFICLDVEIGAGTVIEPMTIIRGASKIGENCHLGPQSLIVQSELEEGATVFMSQVNGATVKSGARVGPYANLRPGAIIGEKAKVGNFVEVKNASLGSETSASHLAYIGDANVGAGSNIGAGVIVCNYDGAHKHHTEVGDGAFVGSNSTLIAPVTIGDGAFVAAGSVITHDVPEKAGAFGRARQETKEGWAERWRQRKQAESS